VNNSLSYTSILGLLSLVSCFRSLSVMYMYLSTVIIEHDDDDDDDDDASNVLMTLAH